MGVVRSTARCMGGTNWLCLLHMIIVVAVEQVSWERRHPETRPSCGTVHVKCKTEDLRVLWNLTMLTHRITIRVLSKSGVTRVERSRNQCNATTTCITIVATEAIIGNGLTMRKGERLRTSRTRICLVSSARTASTCGVAVELETRLLGSTLLFYRPTSRAFEISKVQSEAGPNIFAKLDRS